MATAHAQTVVYYHTDALGTPVAVTDSSGNVVERSEYEPYGSLLNRPLTDGPGYTGHVMDAATGLTYMQQRYYDQAIGVFLSVDPVSANSSENFNRYRYASGNPYKFVDHDGRQVHRPGDKPDRYIDGSCVGGGISCMMFSAGGGEGPKQAGADGHLFYNLPQNQREIGEDGYYNYGTPPNGAGQYGRGASLSTVFKAGNLWLLSGESSRFGVGNMSLKNGQRFEPHSSHRKGLDIDVRPMSVGGVEQAVTWRSPGYDRAATQRLVNTFYATGSVRQIFFNDPEIDGVKPLAGHDNHLHIQVIP